jgi:predicted ATPase/DNA-binding SARP family transcriptional activator
MLQLFEGQILHIADFFVQYIRFASLWSPVTWQAGTRIGWEVMTRLCLFLFGPPRIERGGGRIELGLRKAVGLLAYLAITRQEHSREALAALFWPEQSSNIALGNLRRTIYRVNRTLGAEVLSTTRHAVVLSRRDYIWSDVDEFRDHAGACLGLGMATEAEMGDCEPRLTRAVELCADDLLAGFSLPDSLAFDEWLFFEREDLHQSLGRALERLAYIHQARSEWEKAIAYTRRRVALDPLHEPAHRSLMALYGWSNQLAAAMRQYRECRRILEEQLGIVPEAETTALYEAIKFRQVSAVSGTDDNKATADFVAYPAAAAYNNLPAQSYPFVGRSAEMDALSRLLIDSPEHRLLTLTGPGGIGKTSLAVEAASQASPAFPDGVCFVGLAPLASAGELVPAIAGAIGFPLSAGSRTRESLLSFLYPKRLLLILDSYEHLLPDTDLLRDMLQQAPEVKVLVTSRESLNLLGETVYVVGPMAFPEQGCTANPQDYDAVQLMAQVARLQHPQMQPGGHDLRAMTRICRLVDGMPLAIVLAAGWLQTLSLEEIGDEIERSLDFLESKLLDLPERHHSVRAAFEYSWQRLPEAGQQAFARLSVFRGSFTRRAAERIAGTSLPALRELIDRSFLSVQQNGRYRVHELLRRYGAEHLERSGKAPARRRVHGEEYLGALAGLQGVLKGSQQQTAVSQIEVEVGNIRAAWRWALQQKAESAVDEALESLYLFWDVQGRYQEGIESLEEGRVQLAPARAVKPGRVYGRILTHLGMLQSRYLRGGGDSHVGSIIEEGLGIAREHGRTSEIAFGLLALAHFYAHTMADPAAALPYARQSFEYLRAAGDDYHAAQALRLTTGHPAHLQELPVAISSS